MASLGVSGMILSLTMVVVVMVITPAQSLNCTSQKFTNNRLYDNCNDLPSLTSYLHWTYNSSNSSLSIAFVATPASSTGWIAWAINPTGTGMIGAQSLIAFKNSNGSMIVQTYNLSSYRSISQSKLSFDVWDTSAENSDGVMRIFAKLAVPGKNTSVNQVWQVGSEVTNSVPVKHAIQPENLNAKGTLNLTSGQQSTNNTGGGDSGVSRKNVGFLYVVSFLLLGNFMISSF